MSPLTDIRFDEWLLRRHPLELFRGDVKVRLQEQPLRLLEALLTHPGELVTREQLIALLWPQRIVEFDAALNAAVRRLRAALDDNPDAPRYIETVPRHGYRFVGVIAAHAPDASTVSVEVVGPPRPRPTQRPQRLWWAAAALMLVVPALALIEQRVDEPRPVASSAAAKSIVVLPFADLSPHRDQEHFSDGLTEEVLNALAQSQELRVIARTSSFAFKNQNVDVATVARKLDVTHVLEGSVRKSGDRVRITAQLIDASNSAHLWSQVYDRELTDVFQVQSDIATAVAAALDVALAKGPTSAQVSPEAYEHYLRANFFFQRRASGDLRHARKYFERAVEIDPTFARAWAGLAGVYWIETTEGSIPGPEGLENVRAAAAQALALDPKLPEGRLRLATYLCHTGDTAEAKRQWQIAADLAPNHPLVLSSRAGAAAEAGLWNEALSLQRRALAADPLSIVNRFNLANMLLLAGRHEEALHEAASLEELDPKGIVDIRALILILEQKNEAALDVIRSWPTSVERSHGLALAYSALGFEREAEAALDTLITNYGDTHPLHVAEVLAWRGESQRAFMWLERMQQAPLHRRQPLLGQSPFLRSLHADPRWSAQLSEHRNSSATTLLPSGSTPRASSSRIPRRSVRASGDA